MEAQIILKSAEKELLLEVAQDNSPVRTVLSRARSDNIQPELVIIDCDEQSAYSLLELAAPHCGSAWRVMNYQMNRLGLLRSRGGN